MAVPVGNLVPKPAGLPWESAACLSTAWLTAYRMLFTNAGVTPGATVLVHNIVFLGNSATEAGGTSTDNADVYGNLDADTIFKNGFEAGG